GFHLRAAYTLPEAEGNEFVLAMIEIAESQRRVFLGRSREALALATRARCTFESLDRALEAARLMVIEAIALEALNRQGAALAKYRKAIPIFEKAEAWSNYVGAVNSLGTSLANQGRFTEARREYARALKKVSAKEHASWSGLIRVGLA